jgi:hypothetical protein
VIKITKLYNIIGIALFLGALVGFLSTRTLPEEVKQETTLLSYEHDGRFDYLVHLKPSYLYGPEPVEPPPLPPTPQYPTAIIDTITMSFTYKPASEITQQVEVAAILENPDVWQKKITLVPAKTITGGFTIDFPLNLEEINKLFDTIDEEIKVASFSRNVTIVATVDSGTGMFSQSLPIKIGKTLIEVDSNLAQSQDGSWGQFDYSINLKENSLFDSETLKPPAVTPFIPPSSSVTLKPGQVVFSNLVDKMEATFYYRFNTDRAVNNVTSDVELTVILNATGSEDTELWSKKLPLLNAKKSGDFNVSFPVDLVGYLEFLDTIRKETGASAESNNITISASVHTVAETSFGLIDETFTQDLNSKVKGSVLEWDKELTKTQPSSITTSEMIPNPSKFLGLSVGAAKNLFMALLYLFGFLCLFSVVWYFMFRPEGVSQIERETLQVRKKYRERMAEATSQTPALGEKTISLGSIEDLIKVADELGKPVIHQPPRISEEQHAYYVFDGATRYQYIISSRGNE